MSSTSSTRYVVDENDEIVSVDGNWGRFASANGAPELEPNRVVGRPLWDFLAGTEVQAIYQKLFDRVRASDAPVLLPFRCDSPDRRRFMRLLISPVIHGSLQLDAALLREEPRSPAPLLAGGPPWSGFVVMCSWCKKIRVEGDEWLEVEDAVVRLDLFAEARMPRISHSICPSCEQGLQASLESA